jgi:hypothetical protein
LRGRAFSLSIHIPYREEDVMKLEKNHKLLGGAAVIALAACLVFVPAALAADGFDDVPPGHMFYDQIMWLVDQQITSGCSVTPPLYCPNAAVSRGQMAVFMYRLAGNGAAGAIVDADTLDGLDSGDLYTQAEVDALLAAYDARITALEDLLASVTLENGGQDFVFTGVNVHVRSGSGATDGTINGLGNLIVGYDEARLSGSDKSGSHNLVVGPNHNYTSYGGLVAGYENTINGDFATVSGGLYNTASGWYSSVSGGMSNTAAGGLSSISGGEYNTTSGDYASVSGGYLNEAGGDGSSVSGGQANTAGGDYASVSGGYDNEAISYYASVSGGYGNEASGDRSSVSGGFGNSASGESSSISGGHDNTAVGSSSSVSGGFANNASVGSSSVSGGGYNTASGGGSSVSGGFGNTASGSNSSVSGGYLRSVSGDYDWCAGGLFEDS